MNKKEFKKIFILNGFKSDNIDKAIFVLKDEAERGRRDDIISEAEDIVENYVKRLSAEHHRPVKRKKRGFLSRLLKNP